MKPTGREFAALVALLLLLVAATARAELSAVVDRDRVALGDTLRLTISATDNEDLDRIDLQPLARDFEILQRSTSSRTSIINGRRSHTNELMIDITPRRQGTLEIPAMRLDARRTERIEVTVGPPPRGGDAGQTVLFEAEVDRDTVYVQGQLILTLRVQQAINLEDRSITELKLDNAFVHPLEQNSFQRTMNGRPWLVHEVRYAIFPEQSGTLEIPAQTFSARESVPRRSLFDLGGGGRQLRRSTEPLRIEVLPRPANYPDTTWLPARSLTLEESWSTPPEQLKVGESATRTVIIRGEGLQGAQLPPVMYPATDGLKYYPDQPVINDGETATGLLGVRQDSVAVVPTRAGRWRIPELKISWWDTGSNELRQAVLPAREMDVAAAAAVTGMAPPPVAAAPIDIGVGAQAPSATAGSSALPWQVLAAVNAVGWLATLSYLLWFRRRGRRPAPPGENTPGEKPAFRALLAACAGGDAAETRRALVHWAASLLPGHNIVSLSQVAAALDCPPLAAELDALDNALYGDGNIPWNGSTLAAALKQARETHLRSSAGGEPDLELYPRGA